MPATLHNRLLVTDTLQQDGASRRVPDSVDVKPAFLPTDLERRV
jgi:hypothetical protein